MARSRRLESAAPEPCGIALRRRSSDRRSTRCRRTSRSSKADGTVVTVNTRVARCGAAGRTVLERRPTGANYLDLCVAAAPRAKHGAEVVRSTVARVLHGQAPQRRGGAIPTRRARRTPPTSGSAESWFTLRVTRCEGPEPTMVVVTHDDVTAERRAHVRENGAAHRAKRTRRGRSSEPREERVSRDVQPRAPHSAQRDRRLRAAARDGRPRPSHPASRPTISAAFSAANNTSWASSTSC